MSQKLRSPKNPQPDLFHRPEPHIALTTTQYTELLALVRSLMQEIAANLVSGEAGQNKDHG